MRLRKGQGRFPARVKGGSGRDAHGPSVDAVDSVDGDTRSDEPLGVDAKAGHRTGRAKAAHNREDDPPA